MKTGQVGVCGGRSPLTMRCWAARRLPEPFFTELIRTENQNEKTEIGAGRRGDEKITRVGMCALLLCFLLFLLVTILSTTRLASQVKLISEHPFTVNGDISDVKTDLALMRLRTERLQSYNQPEDGEGPVCAGCAVCRY